MKVALVTGSAGFIGSQIAQACLDRGDEVRGIDLMTDYYDVEQKRANVAALSSNKRFHFIEADVSFIDDALVDDVDVVYHQAGQPGVRSSWREHFTEYVSRNVMSTQRLLEACARRHVPRVVYASSSSVYGNNQHYPVAETTLPAPYSPYGVTKLAAEHLCSVYAANFGLSVVSLRYFTVYGPRQRPDMATHRLMEAALNATPFPLFGSGEQIRDFTYVDDVVAANLLAGEADVEPGLVANIAGGSQCSMIDLIDLVREITGRPIDLEHRDSERGDVARTGALTELALTRLGWSPRFGLRDGLERQRDWHLLRRSVAT